MAPPLQPPAVPVFLPGFPVGQGPAVFNEKIRDTLGFLYDRPRFRARRTTAFTVAENVTTDIQWNSGGIDEDTYSGWDSGTPTRYTVQAAGWYLATGAVSLSGTGANGLVVIPVLATNGVSHTGVGANGWEGPEIYVPTGASPPKVVSGSWRVYAQVGDFIELGIFYTGESAITAVDTTAGLECRLELVWDGV